MRDEKGRFVKGTSGNPKGRSPRDREERYYLLAMNTVTYKDWQKIIDKATAQAARGDAQARKWLAEYLAPKTDRHEVSGSDGGALNVNININESE